MTTFQWVAVVIVLFCCICYLIAHILQGMRIRIKYYHWIPRQLLVVGITLYPWILFSSTKNRIIHSSIKHEFIHTRQVRLKGWILFYLTYLISWLWQAIRKLFGKLKGKTAYDAISYEIEAYARQDEKLLPEERRIYESS